MYTSYEINVSWNGVHYFATAKRSISVESKAREVYETLCKKFPASEGFAVSLHGISNFGNKLEEQK